MPTDIFDDPSSAEGAEVTALVAACRAGDRDAQQRLVEQFHPRVYRLLVRMAGRQEADDVAQQVFLQVFRKLTQFRGEARFDTWLYRIAIHEALQARRRVARRPTVPLTTDPVDPHSDPKLGADQQELLDRALGSLAPELRSVFVLREVEQLSYRDLAVVLSISEGTVASRLSRARHELQQQLTQLGWNPPE